MLENNALPVVHKPSGSAIGVSGTRIFDGQLQEEYNNKLRGFGRKFDIFEQMANDPHIAELKSGVKLPVKRGDWHIERAADTPLDYEMEAFSNDMVFGRPFDPWSQKLDEIMDFVFDGYGVFETIIGLEDWPKKGPNQTLKYVWKEIAWRSPRTVYRWYFDPDTRKFLGIQQYATRVEGQYEYFEIPAEYLLVFTNERRGQNYEGKGAYRYLYKPFTYIDLYEKLQGIYFDRIAGGVVVAHVPKGTPDDRKEELGEALADFRSGEKSYLVLEEGETVDLVAGSTKGQKSDILAGIRYHEQTLAKAVLAPFFNFGTTETGARALGQSLIDFFLQAYQAIGDYVAETFNTYALHPLLARNFDLSKADPPRLVVKGIDKQDPEKIAGAVEKFTGSGVLDLSGDLDAENRVRKMLGLPELSEEEVKLAGEFRQLEIKRKKLRLKEERSDLKAAKAGQDPTPTKDASPRKNTASPSGSPVAPSKPKEDDEQVSENAVDPNSDKTPPKEETPDQVSEEKALEASNVAPCNCGSCNYQELDLSDVSDELLDHAVQDHIFATIDTEAKVKPRGPARPLKGYEKASVSYRDTDRRVSDLQTRIGRKATNFFSSYMDQIVKAIAAGKNPYSVRPKGMSSGSVKFPSLVKDMTLEVDEAFNLGARDFKTEAERLKQAEKADELQEVKEKVLEASSTWGEDFAQRKPKKKSKKKAIEEVQDELDLRLNLGIRKIQDQAALSLTRAKQTGLTGREALSFFTNNIAKLSEKVLRSSVRAAVNIAYGAGRTSEEYKLSPDLLVRSAIFDGDICDICAEKDGQTFRAGDPNFSTIPDPECLGDPNCRCINIPLPGGVGFDPGLQEIQEIRDIKVAQVDGERARKAQLQEEEV